MRTAMRFFRAVSSRSILAQQASVDCRLKNTDSCTGNSFHWKSAKKSANNHGIAADARYVLPFDLDSDLDIDLLVVTDQGVTFQQKVNGDGMQYTTVPGILPESLLANAKVKSPPQCVKHWTMEMWLIGNRQ